MTPVTVLITFHSRSGATETRALSFAVGCVQQRALIRLRRVPDDAAPSAPEHHETVERMRKEYVPPAQADALGADAIVIAATSDSRPDAPEWQAYISLLRDLGSAGKLAGKVAAVVSTRGGMAARMFAEALTSAGLRVIEPGPAPADAATPDAAIAHGRIVVTAARDRKESAAL